MASRTISVSVNMFKTITEGKAKVKISDQEKISSDLPVFYNPKMKLNRDISILLLKIIDKTEIQVCDPLAGTGVRSIRFLSETGEKIRSITINDKNKESFRIIKENLKLNNLEEDERIITENRDANALLLESSGFDYIDIDPFGTPNPFLDMASRRISRDGILAVTATDTSALSGTYINACKRKYWARPRRDYMMHETGLRILIRKCQLIAAQYEKALLPILSYAKDHYMRVFFKVAKGKAKVDEVLRHHGPFNEAGPMWLGKLADVKLLSKMYAVAVSQHYDIDYDFLRLLKEEASFGVIGFYDVHALSKQLKIGCPSMEFVNSKLKKAGYTGVRTHFSPYALKTEMSKEEFIQLLKDKKSQSL